jgi:hypothetical protein
MQFDKSRLVKSLLPVGDASYSIAASAFSRAFARFKLDQEGQKCEPRNAAE